MVMFLRTMAILITSNSCYQEEVKGKLKGLMLVICYVQVAVGCFFTAIPNRQNKLRMAQRMEPEGHDVRKV